MRALEEDEKIIKESEDYAMVTNYWCRKYTKDLESYDSNGTSLGGYFVLRAIPKKKDGEEFYVIYDDKGQPAATFEGHEDFDFKTMLLRMSYEDDNNIICMAKRFLPEDKKVSQREQWAQKTRGKKK